MGKVAKGIVNIHKKVLDPFNVLFGKPAKPNEYLDPELESKNLELAKLGYENAASIAGNQKQQFNRLAKQLYDAQSQPTSAQMAEAEIQNRRRALGIVSDTATRNLNQNIARRGLSGSAAGLFAQARQNKDVLGRLAEIQGQRYGIQNDLEAQRIARQGALLGQYGNLINQIDRPQIQTMGGGTPGQKGLLQGAATAAANLYTGGLFSRAKGKDQEKEPSLASLGGHDAYSNYA